MALLLWPLERNEIRRGRTSNTFGYVRNGGGRPHQGWDLYAPLGTTCYAVADGVIEDVVPNHTDFGKYVLLKFDHRGQTLYAAYCHLSLLFAGRLCAPDTRSRSRVIRVTRRIRTEKSSIFILRFGRSKTRARG